MREILKYVATLLYLLVTPLAVFAQASEQIQSFEVMAEIRVDGTVAMQETIVYDFGSTPNRHGIFRDIPFKYQTNLGSRTIDISEISVTDETGRAYNFETSRRGRNLSIKIGDADIIVSGEKTYVINYMVDGAINFFETFAEFYWNITGTDWQVPINRVAATFKVPGHAEILEAACYAGAAGSTQTCANEVRADKTTALFSDTSLSAGQGLTAAVSLPRGIISEPTAQERVNNFLKDNLILLLPLLTLIAMLTLWYKKGRDRGGKQTIIAQYEPPAGLSPSEIGLMLDENIQPHEITAEIIELAVKGYIKITLLEERKFIFKSKDYQLEKLKPVGEDLNPIQAEILGAIFENKKEIKISSLKNKFYKKLPGIKKTIVAEITKKGYFMEAPSKTRLKFWLMPSMLLIAAVVALSLLLSHFSPLTFISIILSLAIIGLIGYFMPAKTEAGSKINAEILGLKNYIETAEQDRIKFHNAPEKTPERFEKLLPYAVALRLEKDWAKQFKEIHLEPPTWYSGPSGAHFTAVILANDLSAFNSTVRSNMGAPSGGSGSGGGGFSGGGFGGGGGGSW